MISVVINADNRVGYKNHTSTVGDYGQGSLQGVRSVDFLTEGVKNKMSFFDGYETQCILYIDLHEDLPSDLFSEVTNLVNSYGNGSMVVAKPHDRIKDRWYDRITIEALKLATGDYVVHFDNDANALRTSDSGIVERYFIWLDSGYKYVCQPWNGIGDKMFWASTRFFITKKEYLDLELAGRSLYTPFMGKHTPCLEHVLGAIAGDGKVLYPPREDDEYIIFSWARYYSGTLKKLNEMNYHDAMDYLTDCGIHGANDVLDKQ